VGRFHGACTTRGTVEKSCYPGNMGNDISRPTVIAKTCTSATLQPGNYRYSPDGVVLYAPADTDMTVESCMERARLNSIYGTPNAGVSHASPANLRAVCAAAVAAAITDPQSWTVSHVLGTDAKSPDFSLTNGHKRFAETFFGRSDRFINGRPVDQYDMGLADATRSAAHGQRLRARAGFSVNYIFGTHGQFDLFTAMNNGELRLLMADPAPQQSGSTARTPTVVTTGNGAGDCVSEPDLHISWVRMPVGCQPSERRGMCAAPDYEFTQHGLTPLPSWPSDNTMAPLWAGNMISTFTAMHLRLEQRGPCGPSSECMAMRKYTRGNKMASMSKKGELHKICHKEEGYALTSIDFWRCVCDVLYAAMPAWWRDLFTAGSIYGDRAA
jgi:hypothetical protein